MESPEKNNVINIIKHQGYSRRRSMSLLKAFREANLLPDQVELPFSIQEKIKLIGYLSDHIMLYKYAEQGGKTGVPDFDAFLNDAQNKVDIKPAEVMESVRMKMLEVEAPVGLQIITYHLQGIPHFIENIKLMGKPEYEPPLDLFKLLNAVLAMWTYWATYPYSRRIFIPGPKSELKLRQEEELKLRLTKSFIDSKPLSRIEDLWEKVPGPNLMERQELFQDEQIETLWEIPAPVPNSEAILDLSLTKLAFQIGIETTDIRHWGKKKEGVAKINLEKKRQKIEDGSAILSTFEIVNKKPGDYLNTIVTSIFKYLNKNKDKDIKKPSKKKIERIIKSNLELMNKYFREELRGSKNKTRYVYIGQTDV